MAVMIAEHELFNACRVLFGTDMQVSRNFLEYLQLSGIKTAYRKKALETHPDMLVGQQRKSGDLFHMVQQAYENLTGYLDARERGFKFRTMPTRPVRTAQRRQPSPRPKPQNPYRAGSSSHQAHQKPSARHTSWQQQRNNFRSQTHQTGGMKHSRVFNGYCGPVPTRKLLFGHYLYYSGITNWQTIIKALVWQRTRRPRLGELGRKFGWLSSQDILTILKSRNFSTSFGESAVHLGMLTEPQRRLLVFHQQRLQKKFGEYFIQNNLLTPTQLSQLVRQFRSHNISVLHKNYIYRGRM